MFPFKVQLVFIVLVCATNCQAQTEAPTFSSDVTTISRMITDLSQKMEDLRRSRVTMQVELDSIKSENMELKTKLQTLETKYELSEETMQKSEIVGDESRKRMDRAATIEAGVNETVAFYAYVNYTVYNLPVGSVLKFNLVVTNHGIAYSPNTGVFRCPKAGVYVFNWSTTSHLHGQFDTQIMRNGVAVGATLSASIANTENSVGSNSVILDLAQGDQVDIRVANFSGTFSTVREKLTSFSGFLLD